MNEIEKMYENVEPNRNCNLYKHFTECPMKHTQCEDCENFVYPPFTAEKQLELIKFLYIKYKKYEMFKVSNRDEVGIRTSENTFYAYGIDIQNAIANFFNRNWLNLTEKERTQIKEILE
jgi:hypothetical protein